MVGTPRQRGGLYTPDMLDAAVHLAAFPYDEAAPYQGHARSRSCGSTIALSLVLDDAGCIAGVGIRPHACAVGQAAASLFARSAKARDGASVLSTRNAIAAWLAREGPLPDWPGIALLEPALDYPARHAAILLAWDAALDALAAAPLPPLERP